MDEPTSNPLVVALFFVLRCLIPLFIMLGISYLLKKFGFISEPMPPPPDWDDGDQNGQGEHGDQVNSTAQQSEEEGGLSNGNA